MKNFVFLSGCIICVLFVAIFACQVIWLFKMKKSNENDKAKKYFRLLLGGEIFGIIIAAAAVIYFDNADGFGFMPGLTWLFHWLVSIAALLMYVMMLAATVIVRLLQTGNRKTKTE